MNAKLSEHLKQLRLSGLAQTLEVRLQEASANRLSYAEFLELILQDEVAVRSERQIARRTKEARDADFTHKDENGRLLNSVRSIGTLGGATIDNEENYLIKKLFGGGLGVVSIENQARI